MKIGDDFERAVEGLAPKPGSGIDSVTISGPDGTSVTLTEEDGRRIAERRKARGGPNLCLDCGARLPKGAMTCSRCEGARAS